MVLVLDAAVHMSAAGLAGVSLDRGGRIDDLQLVLIGRYGHVIARRDGNHRKRGACRLPAFGTAAQVVVRTVALDLHDDRIAGAFTGEPATGEVWLALGYAIVDCWVDRESGIHWTLLSHQ